MSRKGKNARDTVSAPPQNNAQELRLTPVTCGLGLPCQKRTRLKKQVQTIFQRSKDLVNDHVGEKSAGLERVHDGFGYSGRTAKGNNILQACVDADLAIMNDYYFKKKPEYLVTYRIGRSATRIDFLLTKRHHIGKAANCKGIPGESLTAKYRLLVIDLCDKRAYTDGEYVQDDWGRI